MAGALVQVRVDEALKQRVTKVYEGLGLDLSSAVRMFFTRSVQVGGIPFSVSAESTYSYEDAMENIMKIRSDSVKNGTADMTLDEINAIIADCRKKRRACPSGISAKPRPPSRFFR